MERSHNNSQIGIPRTVKEVQCNLLCKVHYCPLVELGEKISIKSRKEQEDYSWGYLARGNQQERTVQIYRLQGQKRKKRVLPIKSRVGGLDRVRGSKRSWTFSNTQLMTDKWD